MSAINVLITGAAGRMGKQVRELIEKSQDFQVVAAIDRAGKAEQNEMPQVAAGEVNAVIDFSSPELLRDVLKWCGRRQIPLVSGTTGLTADDQELIQQVAKQTPVLWAPNMSLGIALMKKLMECFSGLSDLFDFQIEEIHHKHKKDQPSGTALWLQEIIHERLNAQSSPPVSVRGGGVFGIHKFWALGEEETICIEHTALHRAVFAKGALEAVRWLVQQPAGQYHMADVLKGRLLARTP